MGSDLWFDAIFKLTSPIDGELGFVPDRFAFVQSSITFGIPVRRAVLAFTPGQPGENQWQLRLPLGFGSDPFGGPLSWDAATALPAGYTTLRQGGLTVTVGTPAPERARR